MRLARYLSTMLEWIMTAKKAAVLITVSSKNCNGYRKLQQAVKRQKAAIEQKGLTLQKGVFHAV